MENELKEGRPERKGLREVTIGSEIWTKVETVQTLALFVATMYKSLDAALGVCYRSEGDRHISVALWNSTFRRGNRRRQMTFKNQCPIYSVRHLRKLTKIYPTQKDKYE